jgi:putative phosphonoacetaldehyde dehydrogenase
MSEHATVAPPSALPSTPPGVASVRIDQMRVQANQTCGRSQLEVFNPFSGELLGVVPQATVQDIEHAIARARQYRARLSRADRAGILRRAAELLRCQKDTLAELITAESGLCLKDARHEVGRVEDVLLFGASEALHDDGEIYSCDITPNGRKRRVYTQREPLRGVIVAITPFNHPINQVAHKAVPSIVSNNRMVLKPSEKVPLSAIAFADILYAAGLPPEMLQIVTGEPREIAPVLLNHPDVDMITFTGGVEIGKAISRQAGYRRVVLELGGNDPIIVMDDADLDRAAQLAAQGSYKNSGQRCTAVKRILVHAKVRQAFTERLVAITEKWSFGDPADDSTEMGTVIDAAAASAIEARVNEACLLGARLLVGGRREGALLAPTVLDQVKPAMPLVKFETFGPVSPIIEFSGIDEAIAISNGTAYGLSSSICTNRLDDISRFVAELEVGSVNVWEVPGYRLELTPFGGIKDSGLGYKEGVREAAKSFTTVKTYSLPWDV